MKKNHIHFIGIGGIGMSSLAQFFVAKGFRVTGSDVAESEITHALTKKKIKVTKGQKAKHIASPDLVIYNAAIDKTNLELRAAHKKRIPTRSYAQVLGELTEDYFTIAVAGSHGKSTTTAMIGLMLERAKRDPTVIIGTKLPQWNNNNFRNGKSNLLVIEADEYNRSFHNYHPDIAVVINIDKEHLDTYGSLAGVMLGFKKFIKNIKKNGIVVANYGDKNTHTTVKGLKSGIILYNQKKFSRHSLSVPGHHNQLNAEAAWQVAKLLGVKKSIADAALKSYKGAWRRLERITPKMQGRGILYTDYAHHPKEIIATLEGLKEKYPKKKIVAVFQPHLANRLQQLFKEFSTSFKGADEVVLVPVYKVKGRHTRREKTSGDLARAIKGVHTAHIVSRVQLKTAVQSYYESNAVIVCMSAGDLDTQVRTW
jgi:UDP-N-acetylmuramate--alanine ligase